MISHNMSSSYLIVMKVTIIPESIRSLEGFESQLELWENLYITYIKVADYRQIPKFKGPRGTFFFPHFLK